MAIAWPDLETLKRALDVTSDAFDTELENLLAAAVAHVKIDVGNWDEVLDEPDEPLSEAARLLAVQMAKAPGESSELVSWTMSRQNVNYQRLLKGRRRSFGVA